VANLPSILRIAPPLVPPVLGGGGVLVVPGNRSKFAAAPNGFAIKRFVNPFAIDPIVL